MDEITSYHCLATFYEQCLANHGCTPKGVDWPNPQDLSTRFQVMLDLLKHEAYQQPIQLLDVGCGYGALAEHLSKNHHPNQIIYTGLDISPIMVQHAQNHFPNHSFSVRDIIQSPLPKNSFDYVIMNGVLTEKRELSWNQMRSFAQNIIVSAFNTARKGIAFNVMSHQVDWCNLSLFYWSFDDLIDLLSRQCSRHIIIRHDYGLYEYTVYVYKTPSSNR